MLPASRPSVVWILDDGLIMGGGQRFALRLAEVMRAAGHAVGFAVPGDSRMGAAVREAGFELRSVRYPRLVPPAFWAMPPTVHALRRLFESLPASAVVIGNTARCQGYATAALLLSRRRPTLVHLMQEQDSAHRRTARAVYRRIGALVSVGENAAETYRRLLPDVDVTLVNNFIDAADMERMVALRTPAPGATPKIVGTLARMIPEKGLVELVDELAQVPDAWSQALVGAPEQDQRYAALVAQRIAAHGLEDRIHLLGEVHDVPGFIAAIDALVVPSTGNEGQPTVILEGLLFGRPVVVRRALWSPIFSGLPVRTYETAEQLAAAIAEPAPPADLTMLERQFGGSRVASAILDAAAKANRSRPPELAHPTWSDQPRRDWARHLERHRAVSRKGSPVPTARSYPAFATGLARTWVGSRRTFSFAGEHYRYHYHRYNNTWMNERAVEVPIALREVARHGAAGLLEVGNVLGHYGLGAHEVVDKYEQGEGVRNVDVFELEADRRWPLIVSVSTLEHVGVDEDPRDPNRSGEAARLLASRVAPGGMLFLTVPVGYNGTLDEALLGGLIPGMELRAMRHTRPGPHWEEADPADVVGAGYDWRNSSARAVLVGRLRVPAGAASARSEVAAPQERPTPA